MCSKRKYHLFYTTLLACTRFVYMNSGIPVISRHVPHNIIY